MPVLMQFIRWRFVFCSSYSEILHTVHSKLEMNPGSIYYKCYLR